jgi:LCCL domain/EF hand
MRFKCFLLLIGLGLIFGPATGLGQLHGQAEKTSGKDAPKRSSTDLKERWNQLAGDASVWRRADVTDPHLRFIFDLVAERLQCTNGEITREQFLGLNRRPTTARPDEAAPANQGESAKQKTDEPRAVAPVRPAPASQPSGPDEFQLAQGAEAEFNRRDVNEDGLLNYDEMDDGLRAERDRWDTNQDGFIDLEEFKAYFQARSRQPRSVGRGTGMPRKSPQPATAAGAVDLPANLPDWFRQYDTDGDGQIGLYEWKAAGQPIALFLAKDLNGDGFLTPDEVADPVVVANAEPKEEPQADPGSLMGLQDQIGKVFAFQVTGAVNGAVWGSDVYTSDSTLAMAAVHAGALEVGKTGTVKVRIVAPPPSFTGTTANGVTTQSFGPFSGAYQIIK